MFEELENLGINTKEHTAALEKLAEFMRIFKEKSTGLNLISRGDAEFLYQKHIYDSLAFNLFRLKYLELKPAETAGNKSAGVSAEKIKLLDIGSGGGFPAAPAAIMFDDIDITAVDAARKKINFIQYAADELELKNLHPACGRIEEMNLKAEFSAASSRAVSEIRTVLEYASPCLIKGGFLVLYKSIRAEDEIKRAENALRVLNSKVIDIIEYTLPLKEPHKRNLVIIQKIDSTPDIYPRRNGLAAKKPL